jgi:plasmid stabilization system protein ParE
MARGDKSAYTEKQKRQAEHIEEGYERRGMGSERAEGIAWATVNKETGGGKKSGSGRGSSGSSSRRSSASQSTDSKRSAAAQKGWETRRRKGS